MKFSRPALASAAAVALALSSITVVNSAQVSEPLAVATLDDASDHTVAEDPTSPADPKPEDSPEGASEPDNTLGDPANQNPTDPPAGTQGNEELENKSQVTPDHQAQPEVPGEMTRMDNAPKKVSGGGEDDQWWFRTTKSKRDKEGKSIKDSTPIVEGWNVFSTAMNRNIPVAIIPARDKDGNRISNAPTLYMLNGAGGAEQNADWISSGDADVYFENKGVNVVIPMEGAFSYYVDWLADEKYLTDNSPYFKGAQKWTTFLGKEMIPAVEQYLDIDSEKAKRAVVGMSMSATSSLLLAEHYPDMFDAVGSFSGCAATSTPLPWAFAGLTVNRAADDSNFSSITPAHAWGPMGSPYNRYNDALVNAEKLRGSALYISNASGMAAAEDMLGYRRNVRKQELPDAISGSMTTTVEGGVIEGATNACTHDLRAKLNSLDIPAHYEFKNAGTHSWPVWKDDMVRSWNTVIGPRLFGDAFVADPNLPAKSSWNAEKSS